MAVSALNTEELHNFYSKPNISRRLGLSRKKWPDVQHAWDEWERYATF